MRNSRSQSPASLRRLTFLALLLDLACSSPAATAAKRSQAVSVVQVLPQAPPLAAGDPEDAPKAAEARPETVAPGVASPTAELDERAEATPAVADAGLPAEPAESEPPDLAGAPKVGWCFGWIHMDFYAKACFRSQGACAAARKRKREGDTIPCYRGPWEPKWCFGQGNCFSGQPPEGG